MLTHRDQLPQEHASARASHTTPYAVGPIDPTQFYTQPACLSCDLEMTLLVPRFLPPSLLTHQRFKVGYEDGADYSESGVAVGERWTTLELLKDLASTLVELCDQMTEDISAWIVGFVLGWLSCLAERGTILAHVCHLLSFLPAHGPASWETGLDTLEDAHRRDLHASRHKVRAYRLRGKAAEQAERLVRLMRRIATCAERHREGAHVMRHLVDRAVSCVQEDQKKATPRAHTTLCEDVGSVAFLQEDPTCIFPFHSTAFFSRLDEQWYVNIQTANGQRKIFPLVCATGSEALALCSWLNNLAEAVMALPSPRKKEADPCERSTK